MGPREEDGRARRTKNREKAATYKHGLAVNIRLLCETQDGIGAQYLKAASGFHNFRVGDNRPVSACSGVVSVTTTFRGQALPKVLFHFARTVRRSDG